LREKNQIQIQKKERQRSQRKERKTQTVGRIKEKLRKKEIELHIKEK
jgi:hypothetical protein